MRFVAVFSVLALLLAGRLSAAEIPVRLVHPLSEEVETSADTDQRPRRVVLGALEKVNQVLEPEKYVTVPGARHTATYYLPESRRTEDVSEYYLEQLGRLGQVLFSCEGRTCGSSNYWANRIMERAILYGPEQFQRYHVAELTAGTGYLAVYIGQRATRKIYVHVEWTDTGKMVGQMIGAEALEALKTYNRFVVDGTGVSDSEARQLAQVVLELGRPVVVVVHDVPGPGESLSESIGRTEALATTIREQLVAAAPGPVSVDARGVGPLGPSDIYGDARIEFVVIDR